MDTLVAAGIAAAAAGAVVLLTRRSDQQIDPAYAKSMSEMQSQAGAAAKAAADQAAYAKSMSEMQAKAGAAAAAASANVQRQATVTLPPSSAPKCGNVAGTTGCACLPDGSCNWGLRCHAYTCETCPVGTHGCPCDAKDQCPGRTKATGKLYCKSSICKKRVHHGIWPFDHTSFEGVDTAPAYASWAIVIGLTGALFWATLQPVRRSR